MNYQVPYYHKKRTLDSMTDLIDSKRVYKLIDLQERSIGEFLKIKLLQVHVECERTNTCCVSCHFMTGKTVSMHICT